MLLPLRGVSAIDVDGAPFRDADADLVLFEEIRSHLRSDIECIEIDTDINDEAFAVAAAKRLLEML